MTAVSRRLDLAKDREVWSSRERFYTEGIVDSRVRAEIARSWQRSRQFGVPLDREPPMSYTPVDPDDRLVRLARRILDRLADEVADPGMAVILTDPQGLVLDRRAGRTVMRGLDKIRLAPGYAYSEWKVGTNGMGTAAEDRRTSLVVGSEHYAEHLSGFSCAGAVIRNPMTSEVEGILDVTCRVQDTSPLMIAFVTQAAREIERELYEDTPLRARERFELIRAAEEEAALRERQRIARELHDSVSQALYGIALGVEVARDLAARAPEKVAEPLGYVHELARTGMAEMRALIVGLRPDTVEKEGLVLGLTRQIAAVEAHHGIAVEPIFPAEPMASPDVKYALLRIGQEALHNIAKHANATRVQVRLESKHERLALEIVDDGVGFDAGRDFPGHLGLVSMQERMRGVGGRLAVASARGQGTRIRAEVLLSPGQSR